VPRSNPDPPRGPGRFHLEVARRGRIVIGRPLNDQPTDNPPARVFLKAPAGFRRLRTTCERVVDDFRNPRLKLAAPPGQSELVIEFHGCRGELTPVIVALVALGTLGDTKVRFHPFCPCCCDPSACGKAMEELLRTCHPGLQALIHESLDIITNLEEES